MKKKKCKCVIHVVKIRKNNKKKVIITLVGLALVAGGSYVYFQSHFYQPQK